MQSGKEPVSSKVPTSFAGCMALHHEQWTYGELGGNCRLLARGWRATGVVGSLFFGAQLRGLQVSRLTLRAVHCHVYLHACAFFARECCVAIRSESLRTIVVQHQRLDFAAKGLRNGRRWPSQMEGPEGQPLHHIKAHQTPYEQSRRWPGSFAAVHLYRLYFPKSLGLRSRFKFCVWHSYSIIFPRVLTAIQQKRY